MVLCSKKNDISGELYFVPEDMLDSEPIWEVLVLTKACDDSSQCSRGTVFQSSSGGFLDEHNGALILRSGSSGISPPSWTIDPIKPSSRYFTDSSFRSQVKELYRNKVLGYSPNPYQETWASPNSKDTHIPFGHVKAMTSNVQGMYPEFESALSKLMDTETQLLTKVVDKDVYHVRGDGTRSLQYNVPMDASKARMLCQSYGGSLVTDRVLRRHQAKKSLQWCSHGWTASSSDEDSLRAMWPISDKMSSCGKPGVNSLGEDDVPKFSGVNCIGTVPSETRGGNVVKYGNDEGQSTMPSGWERVGTSRTRSEWSRQYVFRENELFNKYK